MIGFPQIKIPGVEDEGNFVSIKEERIDEDEEMHEMILNFEFLSKERYFIPSVVISTEASDLRATKGRSEDTN